MADEYTGFQFAMILRKILRTIAEVLKAETGAKVQKFAEWALKCMSFHSRCQGNRDRVGHNSAVEILLQLSAFKTFLDLAGNHLTGKDFTEAFNAACFPLTLFLEDGNAVSYLGPLTRAAERYCMPVVEWFVERGCQDMEICLALTAATSSSQVAIVAYLLPHVPLHILAALSIEILKAAGERSGGSLERVVLLLRLNFLGNPAATYAVADSTATSDDEAVVPYLRAFLQEHWSEAAF
ncbi:Ankyrin repeat family protein [Forsythia ovata]|uniref:Ankyrin repeat family protein n=1 Tax=Forsythia ovata TaxID=205694 RepID=A0ABD1T3G2_9LAMI